MQRILCNKANGGQNVFFATGERMEQHITKKKEELMHSVATRVFLSDWTHVGQYTIREPIDLIRAATGEGTGSNC